MQNRKSLFIGGMIAIALAAIVFWATRPAPFRATAVPSPNGYDDLQRAARMIHPDTDWWDQKPPDELAAIVASNAAALDLVRGALDRPSRVPINWDAAHLPEAVESEMQRAQSLRAVYRALLAERRNAMLADDVSGAIQSALDLARLSAMAPRGGLLIDYQISWAYRGEAARTIYQLVRQMSDQQCEMVAEAWRQIEWPDETVDVLIEREQALMRRSQGLSERMSRAVNAPVFAKLAGRAVDAANAARKRTSATSELLQTRLALRRYELDRGQLPPELSVLPPNYMTMAPTDPFTGRSLIFRRYDDGGFDLYSVGENGVDDGGVAKQQTSQDDVNLATPRESPASPKQQSKHRQGQKENSTAAAESSDEHEER